MQPGDRKRFAQVLLAFGEIHGRTLTKEALELYWATMQHWDIQDFESAAKELLRASQWFPKPFDFEALRDAGELQAPEAWALALQHVRSGAWRNGSDRPLDHLVHATAAAVGGWYAIATTPEPRMGFVERNFLQHFETLRVASRTRTRAPAIAPTPAGALLGAPAWEQLTAGIIRRDS